VSYLHFLGKMKEAILVFSHALQSYYDSYSGLFEYAPRLGEEPEYINLIEQYKPTND